MKVETADVAIKAFVGLKPTVYSLLVDDSSEHKKEKGMNKNVVGTKCHNKCKNILLDKKCLRHSINRIQNSKNRKI